MKAPFTTPRVASWLSGTLFALLFASTFAVVGNIEFLLPVFDVEFNKSSPITIRLSSSTYLRPNQVKDEYVERWFPVRIGEKLINKERHRFIQSYIQSKKGVLDRRAFGFFVAAFIVAFFFSQNLRLAWPGRRRLLRSEASCYTLMIMTIIAAITIFFLGRRIGFMMNVVISFTAGMLLDVDLLAFLFFLVQGLAVLPVLKYYRRRKKFFIATLCITGTGVLMIPALTYLLSTVGDSNTITSWRNALIIAAIGGGAVSYPVLWALYAVVRPLMGIVSQSKLNELQELQHPLLKKLQEQAPATWEHSRAIANLAEEAASKIGADALLVRVGAYFHDIGKAAAPEFFVENYSLNGKAGGGPHEKLAPEKSAELIIDHVIEGVKILRSNAIPEAVIEFVYMHHGTNMVEFFWRKYKERAKDVPEDERLSRSHFTYPGMKPQSPEPAILMLADGAEAASRTLQDYTTDEIQKVVSHVFMVRLLNGQLDESGLTMENLRIVLRSFVDSIHFGHHTRVKYQWQREAKPAEPRPRAEPPRPSKPPAKPQEAQTPSPPPPETEAKEPPEEKDADKAGAVDTEKKADEASGRPSPLPLKSEEPVKEEPQSKEALHPKTLKNNDMRAAVATPVPPEPDDR
jgi:putative nucleotidyltransferase with HDIG domain